MSADRSDIMRGKIKSTFCATCLSHDRKLSSVEGLNLDQLCAELLLSEEDRVCWECKAIAMKMNEFRYKAGKAQALMANMIRWKKCDTSLLSFSDLKAVNTSEHIIIGYEVETDPIINTSDIQVIIDLPKQEMEYPENPLSPDVDYADNLDPIQISGNTDITQTKIAQPKNIVFQDVDKTVQNDLRNCKRRVESEESQNDVDYHQRQFTKRRKQGNDDDDHFDDSAAKNLCEDIDFDTNGALALIVTKLNEMAEQQSVMVENQKVLDGGHKDIIGKIIELVTKFEHGNLASSAQQHNTPNFNPIRSLQELQQFENNLTDPEFRAYVERNLAIVCAKGTNTGINNAYALADAMFERKFICECSWTGLSKNEQGKVCLKAFTQTVDFMFSVLCKSDSEFGKPEFLKFIKTILKNSRQRYQSKQMRLSTARKRKIGKNERAPTQDCSSEPS